MSAWRAKPQTASLQLQNVIASLRRIVQNKIQKSFHSDRSSQLGYLLNELLAVFTREEIDQMLRTYDVKEEVTDDVMLMFQFDHCEGVATKPLQNYFPLATSLEYNMLGYDFTD